MAHASITHKPSALGKEQNLEVIFPESATRPLPVLYLLHGLSDNQTSWGRKSSVEFFVQGKELIVVMPDAARSFYTDMKHGENYFTYIAQELPAFIESTFPVSKRREDTYIARLSMGGYGALKTAFTYPERFGGVASFSGVCDIEERVAQNLTDFTTIFGPEADLTPHSLFHLAKQADLVAQKPKIYQWCGTEDFLYDANVKFRDFMETLSFDYTYRESEGGHSWDRWNEQIHMALKFFDLI